MLDIFELSPIDEKDEEEIKKGIMEDMVRAYFMFVSVWEEHKDEIREFLNNKK